MPISIAITTTDARITDANGDNGYGSVRIRPNESYQYDDGVDVIQVTKAAVEILIADGQLQSALNLTPNEGASNVPETYYVVDIDVNNTRRREYWVLQNTPTSLEWGEVTRVPGPYSVASSSISAHEASENPHDQYVRFVDLIDAGTIGEVSDGGGGIPRVDPVTGKLAASFIPSTFDAFPTGTRLLFQQTAAPTGWTKDTDSAYNSAMVVGTTGAVATGGSADPTATHTHSVPSHVHAGPNHRHLMDTATDVDFTNVTFGGGNSISGIDSSTYTEYSGTGDTGAPDYGAGSAVTGANTAPKYFKTIVASKD